MVIAPLSKIVVVEDPAVRACQKAAFGLLDTALIVIRIGYSETLQTGMVLGIRYILADLLKNAYLLSRDFDIFLHLSKQAMKGYA